MQNTKRKRESDDLTSSKKIKTNFILDTTQFPLTREIGHEWTLEIRSLEQSDLSCIPDLFDSIQDHKDFVEVVSNAVIGVVKDEYNVWRCGLVGYMEQNFGNPMFKIPLFATSLHYRRQGLGRLLLAFLKEQTNENAAVVPLAMDDETALAFWKSMGCTKIEDTSKVDNALTKDEKENLIAMKLTDPGDSLEALIAKFKKPVYKDMMKRYANTEKEIELLKECQKQMELGNLKDFTDISKEELENPQEGEDEESDFDINDVEEDEDEEYVMEDLDAEEIADDLIN